MNKCDELWNKLTSEERKEYEVSHEKDVVRYQRQIKELDKNGFFVMADGSKSSDYLTKLKKRSKKDALARKKAAKKLKIEKKDYSLSA